MSDVKFKTYVVTDGDVFGNAKTISDLRIFMHESDKKDARIKELESAILKLSHDWFYFKNDKFRSCRKCGYIENVKNTDDCCSGSVKVSLRSETKDKEWVILMKRSEFFKSL